MDLSQEIIEKDRQVAVKYNQTPNLEEFLSQNRKEESNVSR